jgi:serpin B
MNYFKEITIIITCIILFSCLGCLNTDESSDSENPSNIIDTERRADVESNTDDSYLNKDNGDETSSAEESGVVGKRSMMYATSVEDYNIAAANNAFAFDLYNNIETSDNFMFSPYSVFTAMAVCYDGAKSTTQEEIAYVFNYPLSKSVIEESSESMMETVNSGNGENTLKTSNAIWARLDYPFKYQFEKNAEKYYSANIDNLDFRADPQGSREIINEWVASQTNNKIVDLIPEDMIDSGSTAVIITNAVYFNGKWLNEFEKNDTNEELFYSNSSDEGRLVSTMYTNQSFIYGENQDTKILRLPYKGNKLSMYVVLPDKYDIDEFENDFSYSDYTSLKASMTSNNDVRTWLPKFKFDSKSKLADTLKSMGVVDAFSDSADFSSMSKSSLSIDDIVHQAYIDVQEEGTEAAASTAIEMTDCAVEIPPPPVLREFRADHPFMFFIEDGRTGCILFMGKVVNPEYEE